MRIGSDGTALVAARCQTVGTAGNVPANVVNSVVKRVEGVQEVTNPVPFEGGTETEDDASLRARGFEIIRFPITSGNEHYYEYLAKEVPGIGKAKCKGTWAGPGTVKLTLLSTEGDTPDATLIDNVRAHVEAQRLIGADITYKGAVPLPVAIAGRLLLQAGYMIEDITPAIRAEFDAYFEEIAFDGVTEYLSYHKAIEMVFRVPGIADIVWVPAYTEDVWYVCWPFSYHQQVWCWLRSYWHRWCHKRQCYRAASFCYQWDAIFSGGAIVLIVVQRTCSRPLCYAYLSLRCQKYPSGHLAK